MPLRAFSSIPAGLRNWTSYLNGVEVHPDDDSVTTAKLADLAVTEPKLAVAAVSARVIATNAVTTNAVATEAITLPKMVLADTDGKLLIRRFGSMAYDILADADIPATIARDSEVATAIATALATYAQFATGTYTGAFTGTATDPAPVLRYSKVGSLVTLYLPQASATSNATGFTISGAPAPIFPARLQKMIAIVQDNGSVSIGTVSMNTSGILTFGVGITGAVFTATGTKGIELLTLSYSLD